MRNRLTDTRQAITHVSCYTGVTVGARKGDGGGGGHLLSSPKKAGITPRIFPKKIQTLFKKS